VQPEAVQQRGPRAFGAERGQVADQRVDLGQPLGRHRRDDDFGRHHLAANPAQVEKARANPKLAGWFVGQVMKATGGKANPQAVNEILQKKLLG
jgi:hypothetical protein